MLLDGVRVLDLTYAIAGPVGTVSLADLGAEVIKIEGPFASQRTQVIEAGSEDGEGPQVLVGDATVNFLHRNKKSAVLDLTKPRGKELFLKLVRVSDVVIDNYTHRVMPNFGLDYPVLEAANPRIIMISMPGYGPEGPYKEYPSFGESIEATSGLAHLTGYTDGPPTRSAIFIPDPITGLHAALATVVCLNQRMVTGRGQRVVLSQLESATQLVGEAILDFGMNGRSQTRQGNRQPGHAPHGIYPCRGDDEWVAIAVGTEDEWDALCEVMGNPSWTGLPEFADPGSRYSAQDSLDRHISGWTEQHAKHDVMSWLQEAGVPAGAVLTTEDLVHDPHLRERGYFWEYGRTMADGPTSTYVGGGAKYDGSPTGATIRPPAFGEHNSYVFGALLGLSAAELQELEESDVTLDILPKTAHEKIKRSV